MVFCFKYNSFCDQLTDKTKKIDSWIKKKCQKNSVKIIENDDLKLKEIKYIKRIECHISDINNEKNESDIKLNNILPEPTDNENIKNQNLKLQDNHFLSVKENISENLNKNIDNVNEIKKLESCSKKNDWEFFYVIDNDEKKNFDKNDSKKQKDDKLKKINNNEISKKKKESNLKTDFENLNLSDLEWDDFEDDNYSFFDEDDLLIK